MNNFYIRSILLVVGSIVSLCGLISQIFKVNYLGLYFIILGLCAMFISEIMYSRACLRKLKYKVEKSKGTGGKDEL